MRKLKLKSCRGKIVDLGIEAGKKLVYAGIEDGKKDCLCKGLGVV